MSHQLYGTQECHVIIRKRCCDYIELERDYFIHFLAEDGPQRLGEGPLRFTNYIAKLRRNRTWGGNLELLAFAELYRRTIEVYRTNTQPDHIFGRNYSNSRNEEPLRLHFQNGNHYQSILKDNQENYFELNNVDFIEEKSLNEFKSIKKCEGKQKFPTSEKKQAAETEEIQIKIGIQESLTLAKIEDERSENRKAYKKELMEAIKNSMEIQ